MNMPNDKPQCLIIECSEAGEWLTVHAGGPVRIPEDRRPTAMQCDLETAEAEAKRLAERHPGRKFIVFQAKSCATTITVPTHTTVTGKPWGARTVAVLLGIGEDDGIPF
jgi:hypothetical protein